MTASPISSFDFHLYIHWHLPCIRPFPHLSSQYGGEWGQGEGWLRPREGARVLSALPLQLGPASDPKHKLGLWPQPPRLQPGLWGRRSLVSNRGNQATYWPWLEGAHWLQQRQPRLPVVTHSSRGSIPHWWRPQIEQELAS